MSVEKLPVWIAINKLDPNKLCQFIVKGKKNALVIAKSILNAKATNINLQLLEEIPYFEVEGK